MGLEFAIEYGDFARSHQARPGQMLAMAEELFQTRLELAAKYNTFFAKQMTEPVRGFPYWQARRRGLSHRRVFSFGLRDVPRADLVWAYFKAHFKKQAPLEDVETMDFPLYKGLNVVPAEVHRFSYPAIPELTFKVYVLSSGQYYLEHTPDEMVPLVLKRLEALWDRSLDKYLNLNERWDTFAEWEWLWFWTNPFGRAGASVGATLALLWEADISQELGRPSWRRSFFHQDLEALSRTLSEYKHWRRFHRQGP